MRYKPLGNTEIEVSEYGLGTWAMGGGAYGVVDDAESFSSSILKVPVEKATLPLEFVPDVAV